MKKSAPAPRFPFEGGPMIRIAIAFTAITLATIAPSVAAADTRSVVTKALFRNDGEGFVPPAENSPLQALLATKPVLTFYEACGVGDAAAVARALKEDQRLATSWNDF